MQIWKSKTLKKFIISNLLSKCTKSTMSNSKRIAICQMTSVADKSINLKVVANLISDAVKNNVEMLFFPEACDYVSENKEDIVKLSEPLLVNGVVSNYRRLAKENNVWLSMGGVHEKDELDPSKMYNTHLLINNEGEIVQAYRKLHLFDVEIPEKGVRLKESDFCHLGGELVAPVDTPVGRIGLAICFDLRFPEVSTALSTLSADILTYPSAFTKATGEAHWHTLLKARAIENQCYVIAAAQSGRHNPKRESYGHALCVDPWGDVLADCGEASPCYKVAEISRDKIENVRRNIPVFKLKRKDVYSVYTLKIRKILLPQHKETAVTPASSSPTLRLTDDQTEPSSSKETNVFGHVRIPEACVFYKSKWTYAFVNLRCVIPGHVLVAPLRLAERNQDLNEDEATDFFRSIRIVQKLMEKVHKAESCTVTIQDGPDAGQTVKHLHCHIMPRKKGDFIENDLIYLELAKHDQFKPGHPAKPPRSLEDMTSEAENLRDELEKMYKEDQLLNK